jgi:hypothetical protein
MEDELAAGGGGVDRLLEAAEPDAAVSEAGDGVDQMPQGQDSLAATGDVTKGIGDIAQVIQATRGHLQDAHRRFQPPGGVVVATEDYNELR